MRPGENVWTAFDDDGDTVAELIVTSYACDATGAPNTQYYGGGGYCMGYYQREGASYALLRTDIVASC
jgi:hypothetical protein